MKTKTSLFLTTVKLTFLAFSFPLLILGYNSLSLAHTNQNTHDHNSNHSTDKKHQHKTLDISSHSPIPQVKINIVQDNVKGWNLELNTDNFTFISPEIKESNPNRGHAHLYINGEKVTRIYSNWFYLPDLPEGKNEIKVTLNTNNHEDLVYQNQVIGDSLVIEHKK